MNGRNTKVLVDLGTTHSFVAEEETKQPGNHYTNEPRWLKFGNSPSNPIQGVSHGLPMKIAHIMIEELTWTSKI